MTYRDRIHGNSLRMVLGQRTPSGEPHESHHLCFVKEDRLNPSHLTLEPTRKSLEMRKVCNGKKVLVDEEAMLLEGKK